MSSDQVTSLLHELQAALARGGYSYACGGRIPIAQPAVANTSETQLLSSTAEQPRCSDPVTLRWDISEPAIAGEPPCRKVTLPATQKIDTDALASLLQDCQPATFGLGGRDVYDEAYRKALKMDPTAFCSTVDPHALGIVDTIAQLLLPSFMASSTHRAVEARLYKLNASGLPALVYSGPSGKFKAHVDTPRSPLQFGSLVICLPAEHQGGQLKVRHNGDETTFDWSSGDGPDKTAHIEWAAFYSDCEHEVMEVSSGHRLTLTYNLYAVCGAGRLTGAFPALDPARLPLYRALDGIISSDPFSGQGGRLGFWCTHAYAYNDEHETPFPHVLKGVDAAVWESLKALCVDVQVAPIVTMDDERLEELNEFQAEEDKLPAWIIGKKFGLEVDGYGEIESSSDMEALYNRWGSFSDSPIVWLTTPKHEELQIIYTAYGNQGSAETIYSRCAILATLPAATQGSASE
ncbi:hypothetical protein NLG97_g304 [Lecanicillium saksenae]|uniref:Uncharacterized protein n=1 Tax=Lecanicillium saksenae TaxID=468837 RepID=A0ACC1RAD8_9HYPO|nr:hypothetical protein NLG97_g304 [Lecanicillium saksenae]